MMRVRENSLGARIREARESARVQQDDLERRCGLPRSSISKIESGDRAVKAEELASIASALGVSPIGLLEPDSFLGSLSLAARDVSGLVAAGSIRSLLVDLAELHQVLSEDGIPATVAPDVPVRLRDDGGWLESSTALAQMARERLGSFAPTVDGLAAAIEAAFGVDVMLDDVGDQLLGASIVSKEFPFIFVNTEQNSRRALFTLAHELGHVLADSAVGIHEDVKLGGGNAERDANVFAASLLMPEQRMRALRDTYASNADFIASMLGEFGVSYESLIYRMHNVRMINASTRDRLKALSWAALLPLIEDSDLRDLLADTYSTTSIVRRPPQLLLKRTWQGYNEGVVSLRPYARLLGTDPDELYQELGQEGELLDERPSAEPAESLEDSYATAPF